MTTALAPRQQHTAGAGWSVGALALAAAGQPWTQRTMHPGVAKVMQNMGNGERIPNAVLAHQAGGFVKPNTRSMWSRLRGVPKQEEFVFNNKPAAAGRRRPSQFSNAEKAALDTFKQAHREYKENPSDGAAETALWNAANALDAARGAAGKTSGNAKAGVEKMIRGAAKGPPPRNNTAQLNFSKNGLPELESANNILWAPPSPATAVAIRNSPAAASNRNRRISPAAANTANRRNNSATGVRNGPAAANNANRRNGPAATSVVARNRPAAGNNAPPPLRGFTAAQKIAAGAAAAAAALTTAGLANKNNNRSPPRTPPSQRTPTQRTPKAIPRMSAAEKTSAWQKFVRALGRGHDRVEAVRKAHALGHHGEAMRMILGDSSIDYRNYVPRRAGPHAGAHPPRPPPRGNGPRQGSSQGFLEAIPWAISKGVRSILQPPRRPHVPLPREGRAPNVPAAANAVEPNRARRSSAPVSKRISDLADRILAAS